MNPAIVITFLILLALIVVAAAIIVASSNSEAGLAASTVEALVTALRYLATFFGR